MELEMRISNKERRATIINEAYNQLVLLHGAAITAIVGLTSESWIAKPAVTAPFMKSVSMYAISLVLLLSVPFFRTKVIHLREKAADIAEISANAEKKILQSETPEWRKAEFISKRLSWGVHYLCAFTFAATTIYLAYSLNVVFEAQ